MGILDITGGFSGSFGGTLGGGSRGGSGSVSMRMPTKARLLIENRGALECSFNPDSLNFSRSVNWNSTSEATKDHNTPKTNFQGISDTSLSLKLFFDTTLGGGDVRGSIAALWTTVTVDKSFKPKPRPPFVTFMWGGGDIYSFKAAVLSLSVQYVLFNPSGAPIRATADLKLKQIEDDTPAGQNPTSRAIPGDVYTVQDGDRLDLIAARYYNKPMLWRYIAEHNNIDNPRELQSGTRLVIPPIS